MSENSEKHVKNIGHYFEKALELAQTDRQFLQYIYHKSEGYELILDYFIYLISFSYFFRYFQTYVVALLYFCNRFVLYLHRTYY